METSVSPIADLVLTLSDFSLDIAGENHFAMATATLEYLLLAEDSIGVKSPPYRVSVEMNRADAEDIRWYVERYVDWPGDVFDERARSIEKSLSRLGRLLYDILDNEIGNEVLECWRVAGRGSERRFTVVADSQIQMGASIYQDARVAATYLLSLPWELLHDGVQFIAQSDHGVRVRRSLSKRHPANTISVVAPIRLLLISPRPEDSSASWIDHRTSAKPIIEALSSLDALTEFAVLDPPTFPALQTELQRAADCGRPYHVLHFDGHGGFNTKHGQGVLCFENPLDANRVEQRRSEWVVADRIADVLRGYRISLVFLDACQSAKAIADPSTSVACKLLESGIPSVVAMSYSILVETTRRYVEAFYRKLLSGGQVGQAATAGQAALRDDPYRGNAYGRDMQLQDWFVPVLFQGKHDPKFINALAARELPSAAAQNEDLARHGIPNGPKHSFIGRSRDLLKAERMLTLNGYVVMQGSSGEGKTTVGCELLRWLMFTRRFDRGVFVRIGQDTSAREVLYSIGDQLMPDYLTLVVGNPTRATRLVLSALCQRPTVILLDNFEAILPSPSLRSSETTSFQQETLEQVIALCRDLRAAASTHLIFTSRESLPEPFAVSTMKIGRLDRSDAIRLVTKIVGDRGGGSNRVCLIENNEEIDNLVDAVGCHARTLVLLAGEVGRSGVRITNESLREVMATLETEHSGRELSLRASAELSLRRLAPEVREDLWRLSLFQGGGSLGTIALALGLTLGQIGPWVHALIDVGLAELLHFNYLQFDPALMGEMQGGDLEVARASWAEAMATEVEFVYENRVEKPRDSLELTRFQSANYIAALEYLALTETPARIVRLVVALEEIIALQKGSRALERLRVVRARLTNRSHQWSHSRFLAESADCDRLIEEGRVREAIEAAKSIYEETRSVGDKAYQGADLDGSVAQWRLGRALMMSGEWDNAIHHLDIAIQHFHSIGNVRMATSSRSYRADCLRNLCRFDEATIDYEYSIQGFKDLHNSRDAAVSKLNFGILKTEQKRYSEAITLFKEALREFQQIGDATKACACWADIARVYSECEQYDSAEHAYQQSLIIAIQTKDRSSEASVLGCLGVLVQNSGDLVQAARLFREACEIFGELEDFRNEGLGRHNIASVLATLKDFASARRELNRAIKCLSLFGNTPVLAQSYSFLSSVEKTLGDDSAAQRSYLAAVRTFLAYRREGGVSDSSAAQFCRLAALDRAAAIRQLDAASSDTAIPDYFRSIFFPVIRSVLGGSRDMRIEEDSSLDHDDAAELLLLIEHLRR